MRVRRLLLACAGILLGAAVAGLLFIAHHLTQNANRSIGDPPVDLIGVQRIALHGRGPGAHHPIKDWPVYGWYLAPPSARHTVLLLHGVRGDRSEMVHRMRLFRDAGYAVLAIDLSGHGEATYPRITFGHVESMTAAAAIRFIRLEKPVGSIGVVGVSLGGAAALLGAYGPVDADAFVLEAVYADIRNATADRIEMIAGKRARVLQAPLVFAASLLLGVDAAALRPVEAIKRLTTPVLIIAGAQDLHTPIADSRRLFDQANAPKELWVINDAAHTDFERHAPETFRRRVVDFLGRHLGP